MTAITRTEGGYIFFSERGQALQLRLTMVDVYSEDVVRFRFQFVLPLHEAYKRIGTHRWAAWTYLIKQRSGNDHEICGVIFVGAGHVHGHRGNHLNRFS